MSIPFATRLRYAHAFVLLAAACATRPASVAPFDRDLGLETFDEAWRIVYETHFDTTFNGVDWIRLRDELRPRVERATSRGEVRGAIAEMLDRLGQSHFALIPEELADTLELDDPGLENVGDLGIDVRLIDDVMVITEVDQDGPAAAAGVKTGWVLDAVNERTMADELERVRSTESRVSDAFRMWARALARLNGEVGSRVTVTFLDGRDQPVTVELERRREPSRPVKFGDMPTFFSRFASRTVPIPGGGEAGLIWFNFWMVPLTRQVDSVLDVYRDLDGIVVDLRGNRGGVGAMVMGVAGHFFEEREPLGIFKTRTATLRIVANPRTVSLDGVPVRPFAGPVAILVDEASASASEVFAGGMQSAGRARVFGTTSPGAVLPARTDRLPNGDVLYHAFAEFTAADGVRLEGRGVIPDEPVHPTRAGYLAGRDAMLDAALAWIAERRTSSSN